MKINQFKITRTRTMFDEAGKISLPQCPRFREEAENIVALLEKIQPFPYASTGEFQKRIIAEYWFYYDSLGGVLTRYPGYSWHLIFIDWFLKATPPENIRRACQWLVENGIITLKPTVREKSLERAEDIREAIGSSKEDR